MAITMPKIEISFEQRAVSLIGRSERGIAILIGRDDTDKSFTHKQYADLRRRLTKACTLRITTTPSATCSALRRTRCTCSDWIPPEH